MPTVFTTTASTRTVKPTQTTFTNHTEQALTLNFQNGSSLPLANNATSVPISTTITSINRGATNYYDSAMNDYTIAANQAVILTMAGATIRMNVP
ncbi:MAG: hypothetical protein JWQ01_2015 [Massilia sp.]|jgi:hypothetical protein|nr:hypothetical protein [Massilia sp.]